jgi:hypothetical protein
MKSIFKSVAFLILTASCGSQIEKSKSKENPFSGFVYTLYDSTNFSNCMFEEIGTDNNVPKYIFINDSSFYKSISNCCMPATLDYLSGSYHIKSDSLFLNYDNQQLTYYYDEIFDDLNSGIARETTYIEYTKIDIFSDTFKIANCGKSSYFIEKWDPWVGKVISKDSVNIDSIVFWMKELTIYDKMKRKN